MATVSIITPTSEDRHLFNERLSYIVQQQDYPNIIEHLWDYSHYRIGFKRNRLCAEAKGDIIIFCDSDDVYSPDWVTLSVNHLLSSGAHLIGLREAYFNADGKIYQNIYPKGSQPALLGATMCFKREVFKKVRFQDKKYGEDIIFTNDVAKAGFIVSEHEYMNNFLATIHSDNTSIKRLEKTNTWKRVFEYNGIKPLELSR